MNTLIVIGYTGNKRCYVNVPRDEAIRRYCERESTIYSPVTPEDIIQRVDEYVFDDELEAYDVWAPWALQNHKSD